MKRGEKVFDEAGLIRALKPLGSYLERVVVCGSWSLFIYRRWLYTCDGPTTVRTRDLDIAVPRDLPVLGTTTLERCLVESKCRPRRDPAAARPLFSEDVFEDNTPKVVHYEIDEFTPYLEFITPLGEPAGVREVQAGLTAAQLKYLELLLVDPVEDSLPTTTLKVRVAAPASFIYQKSLSFPSRQADDKKGKDLANLFDVLHNFKDQREEHRDALRALVKHYPQWRDVMCANVEKVFTNLDAGGVRLVREQGGAYRDKLIQGDPTNGASIFDQAVLAEFQDLCKFVRSVSI